MSGIHFAVLNRILQSTLRPEDIADLTFINRILVNVRRCLEQYSRLVLNETNFKSFFLSQSMSFALDELGLVNSWPCCHCPYSSVSSGVYYCTNCYLNELRKQHVDTVHFKSMSSCFAYFQVFNLSELPPASLVTCFHVAFSAFSTLIYNRKSYETYS